MLYFCPDAGQPGRRLRIVTIASYVHRVPYRTVLDIIAVMASSSYPVRLRCSTWPSPSTPPTRRPAALRCSRFAHYAPAAGQMSGRKDPRGQSPYLQPVRSQGGSASGGGGSVAGAAPAGAKEAITAVVRQLRGLGVGVRPGISAELLRKAKFDSPDAVGPLRRALHDLVLLSLAGFPPSSSKALEAFWRGRETPAESTDLPPPAAVLLHHYLHAWGCPLEELLLGGRSGRGCVSSRLLLLCFGWLVAQTGALEAALRHSLAEARTSHPPSSEFHMPWADDTSSSAEALAAAKAAEAAAAGFAAEISGVPGSGAGWAAVEAKQHSAMMLFGRVRALLVSLGALQLARHKRIDQCFNLQKDLNNSLGPGAYGNVLTPFEMNLAKSSTKATAAAEWLEAEAAVEEEVVEAAKHARVFFAWIRSASEAISTKEATVEAPSPPPNTPPSMEELEHEVAARAEALEVGVPEMLSTLRQGRGSSVIASGGVNARPTLSNLLRSARERLSQSAEPPLAPGDPPLPEHLARRVEEVIEWHRKLETLEEPPWHHIHRPTKGGLQPPEGCSLTPASEELAALRVSNLAVAKRLAALRASAKRQVRQAVEHLGGPDEIFFSL